MSALRLVAVLALGMLAAAAVSVWVHAPPELEDPAAPAALAAAAGAARSAPPPRGERVAAAPEAAAEARGYAVQQDLTTASSTYRNTTLLVAIRDAGFVCDRVVEAMQAGDALSGWRVDCGPTLAYSVVVGEAGELDVTPLPDWEGIAPRPFEPLQ